jgi:UDP-N-acetylmuramate--alanine ligase
MNPTAMQLPTRIHLLGIGGAGMSAIALVLRGLGHEVAVDGAELVGCSTAIASDNPEVREAIRRGIPVVHRSELLAAIGATRRTLSITGTHGKTTTSALCALAFEAAGQDPSFIIGGNVAGFATGARWTGAPEERQRWFVLEADESDSSFLAPPRAGAIVTNLEPDHLDHYGSMDALRSAFRRFVVETDGPTIMCVDDPETRTLFTSIREQSAREGAEGRRCVSYGTDAAAEFAISDVRQGSAGMHWAVADSSGGRHDLSIPMPGMHLVRNATAVFALGMSLGVDTAGLIRGIGNYRGVGRRFEARGSAAGVTFVDDYAHLPAEVATVLDAAAAGRVDGTWDRIVAVFQPHRYSRTEAVGPEFGPVFADADLVVIANVYGAGEQPRPGVSGELVANAVAAHHPGPVLYETNREELAATVASVLRPGDLCLSLGAGDITRLPDEVHALLGSAP